MATELKKQKPLGTASVGEHWGVPSAPPALAGVPHSHGRGFLRVVPRGADDGKAVLQGQRGARVTPAHPERVGARWGHKDACDVPALPSP